LGPEYKSTLKRFLIVRFTLPQGSDVRVVELEGGQAAEADGEDGQVVGGAHAGAKRYKTACLRHSILLANVRLRWPML
jgi:hypothetical protein